MLLKLSVNNNLFFLYGLYNGARRQQATKYYYCFCWIILSSMNRQNNIDLLVVYLAVPSSAPIIIVSNALIICEYWTERLWKEIVLHNWKH